MNDALSVSHLVVEDENRRVVDDVSFTLEPGRILAVLGPNGAGKSEMVLAIAGVIPAEGEVLVGKQHFKGVGAGKRRAAGVAAVPEGHRLLGGLSVFDNLRAAGSMHGSTDLQQALDNAFEVFPELKALRDAQAGSMSGGQQQMLAIAQALVCRPRFLLLDEMSLGLAPVVVDRLAGVVSQLRDSGLGILLIEQFTRLALELADDCVVMSRGRVQFAGSSEELENQPDVLERAYLGS